MKRILNLISQGEGEMLDFKREISSSMRIAKSLVAFANHKGGTLLVGVNDNRTISGVKVEEEKFMLEQSAVFFCRPEVIIEINESRLQGKTVLEVKIRESVMKPHFAKDENEKWWVYIRVKDQNLLASKVVVDVLRRQGTGQYTLIQYSSKEKVLLEFLSANPRITIKEYCKLINISRWRAIKILVNLVSVGVIRSHTTEKTSFFTLS